MKKKLDLILLIDDDYPTNCFNEMMIEDEGVTEKIKVMQSAAEALDYLSNQGEYKPNGTAYPAPDLIFLDINMPAMNGWEFLEQYHKLLPEQKGKIIVIMLTASPNPDDEAKGKSIPDLSGFLNKPLTPPMLHGILKKYFVEQY